jgi:hypothetical protein
MFVRGSVWVEREIAIVAFRTQALAHRIDVATYCERGLKLEGLRSGLLLDSVQFETVDQISSDFADRVKAGLFSAGK